MKEVYLSIERLIDYARNNLELDERDVDYVTGGILRLLKIDGYEKNGVRRGDYSLEELLQNFCTACIEAGVFGEEDSEYYIDGVMGELSLVPSAVQDKFNNINKTDGSNAATEWLYNYCVNNDYVKKSKLDKNPRFEQDGLIVTINKAKPEFRDPAKAVSGNSVKGGYPKCSICHENEGFSGRNKRTLRTVNIELGGKPWFWQFSPYGYFYQHGIAVNYEHTPMHVDNRTFANLLEFVDMFPHYFIGCNAPLPRIGGSVLAHDHYQGGGEILPMHKAKPVYTLTSKNYPEALAEVVDWQGTVVRIVSHDRRSIVDICGSINEKWLNYENKELGLIPKDKDGQHHALSPTVVKTQRGYEMSLIFRSNITSLQYPDGIFHAHPEFHIIKKESIGLIEAQGLFILPGRLEGQLGELAGLISECKPLGGELSEFAGIYDEIIQLSDGDFSRQNVDMAVRRELGSVCSRILENTAVFKDKMQTVKFLEDMGFSL